MEKEDLNLENAIIKNYLANLELLKILDFQLYTRVQSLSEFINNNLYKERYFLEFIKDNSEFDIYDSYEKKYIYNKKPKQWNHKATSSTNFDSKGMINLFQSEYYSKNLLDLSQEEFDLFSTAKLKVISEINNYKKILKQNVQEENYKPIKIEKFLFIGTLLGRHFSKIANKIGANIYFICEENLEIFRLSLFVADYSIFVRNPQNKVYFSIMDEQPEFINKFHSFFLEDLTKNIFLKYFTTDYNTAHFFDYILSAILTFDPYIYNYRLIMNNVKKISQNIKKYKPINFNKISTKNSILEKPTLLLGAGPSLRENIQWLKENQNKFIIVSIGAALNTLKQFNIKPDIVTSYDPQAFVTNQFRNNTDLIENSIKLLALNSDVSLFDLFKNDSNLYSFEVFKSFQNSEAIQGASVGEASLMILLLLKFKNIFLLGIDLALNQKTGQTHDEAHSTKVKHNLNNNKSSLDKGNYSLREDLIKVMGNFGNEVYTTRLFYHSLIQANLIITHFKNSEQTIFNLSNGSFIKDTQPIKVEELKDLINIEKNENYLCEFFDTLAPKNNSYLKEFINKEMLDMDSLILMLDNIDDFSFENFEKKVDDILKYLKINNNQLMMEIYTNFTFIIWRYISFSINNKEAKKNKVSEIFYIWREHTKTLLNEYKKYLSKI